MPELPRQKMEGAKRMLEWTYYVRPENSTNYSLEGAIDRDSFTKPTVKTPWRVNFRSSVEVGTEVELLLDVRLLNISGLLNDLMISEQQRQNGSTQLLEAK